MSTAGHPPRAGVPVARLRAALAARARAWFEAEDVLEVDVPALSAGAPSDPHIDSVEARLSILPGRPLYLHTSPEFPMKRLLAAGFPSIYALCRVFRDGECGRRHQPEFTMAEWYRPGFGLQAMIDDTVSFIRHVLADSARPLGELRQLTYADALGEYAATHPAASVAELADAAGADEASRRALGEDRDAWLDLLMATAVGPALPADVLTVISHYPASQAALARLDPGDASVAERFEVFAGSLELANGYVELIDAAEQRARIDIDQQRRVAAGKPALPVDARLLDALEAGLPPCAGVAVGFDRLLMLAAGTDDIRDVLHFPFEVPR